MEDHERGIRFQRVEHGRDIALHVDARHPVSPCAPTHLRKPYLSAARLPALTTIRPSAQRHVEIVS